jgi:hypothetical protein
MPGIYPDLVFRNESSDLTSTSSSEFDSFGNALFSSVNMDKINGQDWKKLPYVAQKICGVRIVVTSTNANIFSTTTYNAVISKQQLEPALGLMLSRVTRNEKPLTKDNFTVPFAHIQSLKLHNDISYNKIKVLDEETPLIHMPIPKTAYDQEYISSMFSFEQPNPMLVYDDQPLPFTTNNLIDVSYLQQVYNLDVQLFGFQTWLRKMGVHNFSKSENIGYSSSQTLDSEDFKHLDQALQARLFVTWQESFSQHYLTFHHWFEFYKKKHLSSENCLHCTNEQNEASITEDWDDAVSTFLPPLSSSPKIHSTDLYIQENSMLFHVVDNIKLMHLQKDPNNLRRLEDVAKEVSNTIISAQTWEKPGLASLVNGYSYSELRPKLLSQLRSPEKKSFISFSDYIKDIALDKYFFEEVLTEFDIFKTDYKLMKLPQEAQLETFCVDKRFTELEISAEDFKPSGKLADVYIPNYAYLPINAIETLNITSDRPNGDTISNEDRFYIWARLKLARAQATEDSHWDQKPLLPYKRISPYSLWTVLTKNVSDENVQVIDYHQYVAVGLKASTKLLSSTPHFYDMFIRPLECLFAANTPFGELLLQSRDQLDKAKKIVHIALRLTSRNCAPPTLDYEFIYEELTKIRHLSFIDLQTRLHKDISPLSRIQRMNWPLSPLHEHPDTITFETTSRFEQKARKILTDQREKILLFVDQHESWPFYDMFPEHGGIFMNIKLKKQLYRISSTLQKGNNRPCPPSLPITSRTAPVMPTTSSSASMMSEDDEEDLFLSKKEFALFIDYGIVSEEAAARRLSIKKAGVRTTEYKESSFLRFCPSPRRTTST